MTVTEKVESDGVVSVLAVQRSQTSDSGIYQCRSTSDRSVATRRVNVLNGKPLTPRIMPNSTTRTPAIRTCWTTPTDELTTILQLVVQQICHIAVPEPNISTCQDVAGGGKFSSVGGEFAVYNKLYRIVVSSSVAGVVQHDRSRCPYSSPVSRA